MNRWFGVASGLMAITIVAHVLGGGYEIHQPMLQSDLSLYLKAMASVIWHMATVVMLCQLGILVIATFGRREMTAGLVLIVMQCVGFTMVFLFYGITQSGNISTCRNGVRSECWR